MILKYKQALVTFAVIMLIGAGVQGFFKLQDSLKDFGYTPPPVNMAQMHWVGSTPSRLGACFKSYVDAQHSATYSEIWECVYPTK
jgi:hypothetical protein